MLTEKTQNPTASEQPAKSPVRIGNLISAFRKFADHPVVGMGHSVPPSDPARGAYSRYEAWHFLIFEAAFKIKEIDNKGRTIRLHEGELIAARGWLAERWNWSEATVRWFIDRLEREGMIVHVEPRVVTTSAQPAKQPANSRGTTSKTNLAKVVSICNYELFRTVYELDSLLNNQQIPKSQPAQQPDYIYSTTTEASANAIQDMKAFIGEIQNAAGNAVDPMRNLILNTTLAQTWVTRYGCDVVRDILPSIRRMSQGKRAGSIKTWEYFHDAILDAKEQRCRPPKERVPGKFSKAANGQTAADRMLEVMKRQHGLT